MTSQPKPKLYPEITPYREGKLVVSDTPFHELHYAEYGNPRGTPLLYVHGGPGVGITPAHLKLIDPKKYHIIAYDQRGCGKSSFGDKPYHAEELTKAILNDETPDDAIAAMLADNTTAHHVEDIRKLLTHLKLDKKKVTLFGGSWGSTLSLAYAMTYPETVGRMILRGLFLSRDSDNHFVSQSNADNLADASVPGNHQQFPEAWSMYVNSIPPDERHDMIGAFLKRLYDEKADVRRTAAIRFQHYEGIVAGFTDKHALPRPEDAKDAMIGSYMELTYLANGSFLEDWAKQNASKGVLSEGLDRETFLLGNLERIRDIPITLIHGRHDYVAPFKASEDFVEAYSALTPPAHNLQFIATDGAHSAMDPMNAAALLKATNRSVKSR